MSTIETTGGRKVVVAARGGADLRLTIADPSFGTIATITLDHRHAAELANAIDDELRRAVAVTVVRDEDQ